MKTIRIIKRKIFQHKILIISLLIIAFIFVDFVSFKIDQHSSVFVRLVKEYYFESILEKSEIFYKTYNEALQTDEFIMLLWLWPKRANLVDRVFKTDPFYRIYKNEWKTNNLNLIRRVDSDEELIELTKIFGNNTMLYEVDSKINDIMTDPTDDILLKALYCDETGYDNFDYNLLRVIRDGVGGYGDTHYLLSLLFLEKMGCGNKDVIIQDKYDVIQDILTAESKEQKFSDLFAERIVLLYWAGYSESIRLKWINKIIQNIQEDGGWKDINKKESNPHTTGLAALAIKYFIANDKNTNEVLIK